jgi:GAF domain
MALPPAARFGYRDGTHGVRRAGECDAMATSRPSARGTLAATLRAIHERFVTGDIDPAFLESTPLRREVAESWRRSLAGGVDPDCVTEQAVSDDVSRLREAHPLSSAMPIIRQLLVEDAAESGVVVAVTAADGTLLWVEGDRNARRRAEAMNFAPGADWSERAAGTNAPGTALALDRAIQIRGSEHFARVVQPWSCTAVPIHARDNGALIGALDLTGGIRVVSPQTLALVRATAVAVENHLALLRLTAATTESTGTARLTVLGSNRARWVVTDEHGRSHATTLTGRHADILVLLTRHPEGLTADHLALLLDDKDLDVVTVRAEMSRLRRVIGSDFVESRPYRLLKPVTSDAGDVFDALRAGDVAEALSQYSGELLPQSVSPAIARLRTELSSSLRGAVMSAGNLALLRRWLDLPQGRDDRHGWRLLHDSAQAGSVARAQARGHLAGLDFDLA